MMPEIDPLPAQQSERIVDGRQAFFRHQPGYGENVIGGNGQTGCYFGREEGNVDAVVNAKKGSGTILVVDDEEYILNADKAMLNELGYDGPPTTWEAFAELVCAATDPDAGTVGYEISTDASRFASLVFSRHGTYFLEDGSAFDFQNDTVKETMGFMKDLYDQGCITLIAESYGDQTDFGNYKTLFTIGSTSGVPYYDSAVKSGEQGEFIWGVAPLPYMDGGDEPVMNLYGASVSVPVTTPEQERSANGRVVEQK